MNITKSQLEQIIKEEVANVLAEKKINEIDLFGKKRAQASVEACRDELYQVKLSAEEALETIRKSITGGRLKTMVDEIAIEFKRKHGLSSFAKSDAEFARTGEDTYRAPR